MHVSTASKHACCVFQVGSFGGIADEVQALKRDKNVLMLELVRLRQQQQVSCATSHCPAVCMIRRTISQHMLSFTGGSGCTAAL